MRRRSEFGTGTFPVVSCQKLNLSPRLASSTTSWLADFKWQSLSFVSDWQPCHATPAVMQMQGREAL
jgi:hypothetical protein